MKKGWIPHNGCTGCVSRKEPSTELFLATKKYPPVKVCPVPSCPSLSLSVGIICTLVFWKVKSDSGGVSEANFEYLCCKVMEWDVQTCFSSTCPRGHFHFSVFYSS